MKLAVGNLSFKITLEDLMNIFKPHGTVVEANLMMDRAEGLPRGFAFVTMSTPEEAEKAIQAVSGQQIGGCSLTVNLAKPRERTSHQTDVWADEKYVHELLEAYFPNVSNAAFAEARQQALASGHSVLLADQEYIYETYPDGRRVPVKKIEPPTVAVPGRKITLR